MDEEYKTQIVKKESETMEYITTVLKLIIWSFSLTTFNFNPTNVPTDDGLSVKIGIVWLCFFFLCKNFWNVVKAKVISIIDTQNTLNLNKKNITMNTKTQSKNSDYRGSPTSTVSSSTISTSTIFQCYVVKIVLVEFLCMLHMCTNDFFFVPEYFIIL